MSNEAAQNASVRFPRLFNPLKIGAKVLKNRLNFGPHSTNMSVEGLPSDRTLNYYLERSIGGAGMIVVEPVPVHRTAVFTRGNFLPDDDSIIPEFRRITDACHDNGTVMIQQLFHLGAHCDWDNSLEPNWSPSGAPSMTNVDGSHVMSVAEAEEVIEGFVRAAKRAKAAGFDGCEIMAGYNALFEQFWSPHCNRRDDMFGGTFEKRMRFSTEVLKRIREINGNDFIIGVCVSVDSDAEDVLSLEDQQQIASYHDERGLYDYVSVATGSAFDYSKIIPTVVYEDMLGPRYSQSLKSVVKYAVVQAESHIRTPENAEQVIASGLADMVSIVRGQIADPHFANKAREGREDDIRPCLSCNQQCIGRRYRDYYISCVVNPSAGREFQYGGDRFKAAGRPRKVLVVGGGPAGLEAARVLAERQHQVTLAEGLDQLGGQYRLAGMQPRRAQILDLLAWYERQLEKLQVKVLLNTPLGADELASFDVDTMVLATGSTPSYSGWHRGLPTRDTLPGLELGQVWSAEDVMRRSARLGERVLLLDDGGTWRGVGTAWQMAEQDHKVTIVTPDPFVAMDVARTNVDFPLRQRLKKLGVEFITDSAVSEWHGNAADVLSMLDGSVQRIEADSLVLATVNEPETTLHADLGVADFEVHSIGDCVAPRQAYHAIFEGRRLGMTL